MEQTTLIEQLNAQTKEQRLSAVRSLKGMLDSGEIVPPQKLGYTNNHVHTKYSFSPYSPSKAVWMAARAGLSTVGIMDHDAVAGAEEFIEAGKLIGIATTIGFEIRTDWSDTVLRGRRINNPDQISNAYIAAHGIAHQNIGKADAFLSKTRQARHKRNEKMVGNINTLVRKLDIVIDYKRDVLPISYANDGGGVTERHLLFALTKKMLDRYGKGQPLIDVMQNELGIVLKGKQLDFLSDEMNDMYEYDLLNVFKSSFIKDIYVDATRDEAVPVQEAVDLIKSIGAIPSYCYLGDVGESPTGDKKAQKFEDDYLEEVLDTVKEIGFQAIAYMPTRNTAAQIDRIMALGDQYGFLQISGEDINQPRQSFICKQLLEPKFAHLTDTTWALVGHEISASRDVSSGMFADGKQLDSKELQERIQRYKEIGKNG